jgi:formylglycine-generating enzyme required for sulfatase activity
VDVEGMYSPGLPRPEAVPGGSLGYAHPASVGGVWNPLADRFSGAVLLAEMLSLSSKEMRQQIYGETFFAPEEMQQDCPRFLSLMDHLKTTWGEETAQLFAHAWHSETLSDCDSFGKWMVALPETAPVETSFTPSVSSQRKERLFTAEEVYSLLYWASETITGNAHFLTKKETPLSGTLSGKALDGLRTALERALTLAPPERGEQMKIILTGMATWQSRAPAAQNVPQQNQPSSMFLYLTPNVAMEFVRIPAGEFLMGSTAYDREADSNEKPQRRVLLDEFWMKKYPVTNEQYLVFVEKNFYKNPNHWKNGVIPTGKEKHPVVNVNFEDAIAFCSWVSSIVRRSVLLPSEAQWEKAARGIDGRTYPWGREIPNTRRCNFDNQVSATTLVGAFSPYGDSPYGCADMAGNVWEWVVDWYDEKSYQRRPNPDYNPGGVPFGSMRVLRGGAWTSSQTTLRTTYRQAFSPEIKDGAIGFRCICL